MLDDRRHAIASDRRHLLFKKIALRFEAPAWTVRFCKSRDLREHCHGFLRKFTHRRFSGEHHAIGAVKDRVRHISRLGARGQTARDHRLEHLRCSDHRFAGKVRFRDQLPLRICDFLDRHFHAEIAARHHDSVGSSEDFVEVRHRVRALDFGDHNRLPPEFRRRLAHCRNIGGTFDERLAQGIHTNAEREFERRAILLGECADAQIDAREVQSFA